MFRKIFAVVISAVLAGGIYAAEVTGVFKSYKEGKVTLTVDEKDKEYKVDEKATIKFKIKGEEKEVNLGEALSKLKEGTKIKAEVDGDKLTGFTREKKGK
jgi:hypothetical protein